MKNASIFTTALAMMLSVGGFARSTNGARGRVLGWKRPPATAWHNAARKTAAEVKRERRQVRNLKQAACGGYGKNVLLRTN